MRCKNANVFSVDDKKKIYREGRIIDGKNEIEAVRDGSEIVASE